MTQKQKRPEDKLQARKYFDIEEKSVLAQRYISVSKRDEILCFRGEVLAGPDRAEIWGEELTEIGKWQRTKGPVYVQVNVLSAPF